MYFTFPHSIFSGGNQKYLFENEKIKKSWEKKKGSRDIIIFTKLIFISMLITCGDRVLYFMHAVFIQVYDGLNLRILYSRSHITLAEALCAQQRDTDGAETGGIHFGFTTLFIETSVDHPQWANSSISYNDDSI